MIIENYYYVIWVTTFFTAVVSATIGMLGGTLLLAVMAQYVSMEVLIPVHGIVQFVSNSSRAWFIRSSIKWDIARENILGVAVGSLLGSIYMVRFSESTYNIFIGAFILLITYLPKVAAPLHLKRKWIMLGLLSSYLGLYVGAVGVLVGAVFLATQLKKTEMIATQAMCQSALHLAKVLVFMSIGFVISDWVLLISGTLFFTIFGSWFGTKILDRIPENVFKMVIKILITLLSVRLLVSGMTKAIAG